MISGWSTGSVPARRRRSAALGALLCLPLALTGCSGGDGAAAGPTTAAVVEGSAPAATLPPPTAPPSRGVDDAPVLVLQGDGLSQLDGDTPQPVPFGPGSAAPARQAVEDGLGPVVESLRPDCPQGPRTALDVDGFELLLDGDAFVGWTDLGAPDRALTTTDGLGVGSGLADLQSALPDLVVVPGDAATTWSSATGMSGTLSSSAPDAVVTAVSAGQTCPAPPAPVDPAAPPADAVPPEGTAPEPAPGDPAASAPQPGAAPAQG